jgi:DNA repair protein RecO (recombination protein O)
VPGFQARTEALADAVADGAGWLRDYPLWEMALLEATGFALDLSACAATGATTDLAWVSPKSGRAVGREAGAPYRDRLLPLPGFLTGSGEASPAAFAEALRLTGSFLDARAAPAVGLSAAPPARGRLAARFGV